ncbi:hypothetical protein GCM10010399_68830 [Dactylosporangium fulvum]|uniref:Asp23/Gls24 family envelope stress response protein n=1 Tax=Dactylosporangium fulvum TaxID=53359 RepID=A0ABY5VNZ1_9ACTN|nr:hypothetical protein [Dactylosporangium fulvum]UWP79458.1 hypothetical protein Dfulv_30355 [Dactylosporangium fulvum]
MGTQWKDLPAPRAMTPAERAVLRALVGRAGVEALTAQAATARVTAVCACGCASVRLACEGPAVPRETVKALSDSGRDDYCAVQVRAGDVDVVAHVVHGILVELELFAGEGVKVEIPNIG